MKSDLLDVNCIPAKDIYSFGRTIIEVSALHTLVENQMSIICTDIYRGTSVSSYQD